MKLSFVIPAWNEEKYIGQCLESVIRRARSYPGEIEIIAVNNASTDRTREIALRYSEVKVVDEPKKGLPQARQAGFLASTGELIANIDADSVLPKGWIGRVIREFSKDKGLVAYSGPYVYYDLSKARNAVVRFYYFLGYLAHLKSHKLIQGGNFVLRRTALEKIGGFDVNIKFYGEDTDIAQRISEVGKIKFDFRLIMLTSARRFKKEGMIKTGLRYIINHVWVLIFKKPFTKDYFYVGDEKFK